MARQLNNLGAYEVISALGLLVIGVGFWTGALSASSAAPLILSSFLSTFLGASYAFRLNFNKETQKKRDDQRAALQLALFTLARQYNALANLWNSVKDWEKRPDRGVNMPALMPPPYDDLKLDFIQLSFLLESDDPSLLLALTIEQERFTQTLVSANNRSRFHVDEVQPAIATRNLNKRVMTLADMKQELGERLYSTVDNLTKEMFDHLSSSLNDLPLVAKQLRQLAKLLFPDEKFLMVEVVAKGDSGKAPSSANGQHQQQSSTL